MPTIITEVEPTDAEASHIRSLLADIASDSKMRDQHYFVEHAQVLAHELPRRLRETFYEFKRSESAAALVVRNNPVLSEGAGPTPLTYVEVEPGFELNDAQILHGLYGSLLGEPVGFTSQRGGSIYNTIVPMPDLAAIPNSSSGSRFDFGFHIEDAFHPTRAEYVGLVCMRNDEQATTTVSCIDGVPLTPAERDALFEPCFAIGHNPIHSTSGHIQEAHQPILFGDRDRPYVRVNFATLNIEDYEGIHRQALQTLLTHFEANRAAVVLRSTDCLYIDNFRCVHARDAFEPLPAHARRWLNRVVFTSDLRKSRALRSSTAARAIAA